MRTYVIRRLLLMIPTLFVVTFLIFFLVRMIPGDIIDSMQLHLTEEKIDREALERSLGLDAPAIVQYGRWLGFLPDQHGKFTGILQGDLGNSWLQRLSVVEMVALKWPVTLQLGLMGLIIAQLIALPIGILSAIRQDTVADYFGRSLGILCIAVPGFWLGTLVIVYPSIWWGYMPPIMLIRFFDNPLGNLRMFIAPAIVLGMALAGVTMRMTRTMMLEVLRQDYVRTAWAKGLREKVVVLRHAVKNALIPVVSTVGLQVPVLVGGTVIIEQIFSLPGMGRLLINATTGRDHPVVSGVIFIFAGALMVINLLVDLTYGYLNPRIHYK
jgi:peptide/nickel transport system permease protein